MSDFDARSYLRRCLQIVREDALHADRIDWAHREATLARDADDVPNADAAHRWLRTLIDELGDEHSGVCPPSALEERLEREPESPEARLIARHGRRHAHVVVPSYVDNRYLSATGFARRLLVALESVDGDDLGGWLLDLRGNGGGDMWPMLAGLAPLLDGPHVGSFRDGRGAEQAWRVDAGGSVRCEDELCIDLGRPFPTLHHATAPLAVLTGPRTCSSGEAVVVAFAGRARARRFGQPTDGLSTANRTYALPDGAALFLTASVFVDRDGLAYGGRIDPDVPVASEKGRDAVLEAACRWLDDPV